jgi:hypothetical protein
MSAAVDRPRRHRSKFVALFATALLAAGPLSAQSVARNADLQGIWDFSMRAGERTSPGFFALGPVDEGWAGSITMYLTNTLAIRRFTIQGDSLRMVVASREGDVTFRARLSANADTLQGIVDYHGGARLPMVAIRRPQPVSPR